MATQEADQAIHERRSQRRPGAGTRDLPSLRLRARVFGQTPLEIADSGWAELANVDPVFEHSRDDLPRFVGLALGKLPQASGWCGQIA